MQKYKCPFCNRAMVKLEGNVLGCTCLEDNFTIDFNHRVGWFPITVKNHLQESQRFLEYFYETEPDYVVGNAKLFTPDFKLSDCVFYGCENESDGVTCTARADDPRILATECILLGGNYNLADGFVSNILQGISMKGCKPAIYDKATRLKPKEFLFQKFLLHNVPLKGTVNEKATLNEIVTAYFSPTLEGTVNAIYDILTDSSAVPLVRDEVALYSYLFCNVHLNIAWDSDYNKLHSNIVSYIKACTNDLAEFNEPEPEQPVNAMQKDLYRAFYNCMPSLYVNSDSDDIVSFDVLNMEYIKPYDMKEVGRDYRTLNVWKGLNKIMLANIGNYCSFSMKAKRQWLYDHGCVSDKLTSNQLVRIFWLRVRKELFENE